MSVDPLCGRIKFCEEFLQCLMFTLVKVIPWFVCLIVQGGNPQALAGGLSLIQVDNPRISEWIISHTGGQTMV